MNISTAIQHKINYGIVWPLKSGVFSYNVCYVK